MIDEIHGLLAKFSADALFLDVGMKTNLIPFQLISAFEKNLKIQGHWFFPLRRILGRRVKL